MDTATAPTAGAPPQVVSATIHIPAGDPVFAGHYPGFAVLPGLLLVEYVHRTVAATPAARHLRPVELERVRFVRPVFPGDAVRIEATLANHDDGLHCRATVATESGMVAEIRLRYAARPGRR